MSENEEAFAPNVQMGIIVAVIVLMFLFFGISESGGSLFNHSMFYLMMFLGGIIGAFLVYGEQAGEKLHFTTRNLPLTNVVLYGILLGLMLALVENFASGNTIFVSQSVETSESIGLNAGAAFTIVSTITFAMLYSFITATGEETLTRGFLASLAENFADNETTMKISKYVLVPLIFTLLHFFMWNNLTGVTLSLFILVFLLLYHYTFAVVCQFAMDVTGSIYTPIAIHMVYNGLKMLMVIQAKGGLGGF